MKTFSSFQEFAVFLGTLPPQLAAALPHALEKCLVGVEEEAKSSLGHYNGATAPFSAWAPLAESTKADREQYGFTPDDPLLRSQQLHDAITHEKHEYEGVVGVKDGPYHDIRDDSDHNIGDIAVWMEFGTHTAPPRPFLGPAAVRRRRFIEQTLGVAAYSVLAGSGVPAWGPVATGVDLFTGQLETP